MRCKTVAKRDGRGSPEPASRPRQGVLQRSLGRDACLFICSGSRSKKLHANRRREETQPSCGNNRPSAPTKGKTFRDGDCAKGLGMHGEARVFKGLLLCRP